MERIRISNCFLWQIAYAELYFTETHWPDFKPEDLYKAILDYQNRDRRFGGIKKSRAGGGMRTRIISAIIGIVILGFIVNTGGLYLYIRSMLFKLVSTFELYTAFKNINIDINLFVSFFFYICHLLYFIFSKQFAFKFHIFLFCNDDFYELTYNIINNKKSRSYWHCFYNFSFTYTTMSICLFYINKKSCQRRLILYAVDFVITWVCDSAAFFTGNFIWEKQIGT